VREKRKFVFSLGDLLIKECFGFAFLLRMLWLCVCGLIGAIRSMCDNVKKYFEKIIKQFLKAEKLNGKF
jgi:hypothetical protein